MNIVYWICCISMLLSAGQSTADGKRILVSPIYFGFNTRLVNMEKMANMLVDRGHEVYILVPASYKTCTKCSKLSSKMNLLYYPAPGADTSQFTDTSFVKMLLQEPLAVQVHHWVKQQVDFCEPLLKKKKLLFKLKEINFDVVLTDSWHHCMKIIVDYLDKPFALFSNWGFDTNPDIVHAKWASYMPTHMHYNTDVMNFWQRFGNLLSYCLLDYYMFPVFYTAFQELREKYQINATLLDSETFSKASVVFLNSDFVWDTPKPLMPHVININHIGKEAPKPLPKNIQNIIHKAGSNGVILVSFGTLMNLMGAERVKLLMIVFKGLKQQVLWQSNGMADFTSDDEIPENVHILEWAPQNDILADNNTKLFITHSGSSSMRETIYHGVPVVAIPLYIDQFRNGALLTERVQMGIYIDFNIMNADILQNAIHEILTNQTYKEKALLASKRTRTELVGSKEKFIFYMEQAAEPGALGHLYPHGFMALSWYQYLMLDIAAFLLVLLLVLLVVIACIIKFLIRACKKLKVD